MSDVECLSVLGPAFPPDWLRYRDAFAVLQYLCTMSAGEPGIGVPWQRIASEMGFTDRQADELLVYLTAVGCVGYQQGRREVVLTPKALDYLEWEHGSRRSVRPELTGSEAGAA